MTMLEHRLHVEQLLVKVTPVRELARWRATFRVAPWWVKAQMLAFPVASAAILATSIAALVLYALGLIIATVIVGAIALVSAIAVFGPIVTAPLPRDEAPPRRRYPQPDPIRFAEPAESPLGASGPRPPLRWGYAERDQRALPTGHVLPPAPTLRELR
jgi:hypothetical protein